MHTDLCFAIPDPGDQYHDTCLVSTHVKLMRELDESEKNS